MTCGTGVWTFWWQAQTRPGPFVGNFVGNLVDLEIAWKSPGPSETAYHGDDSAQKLSSLSGFHAGGKRPLLVDV